MSYFGVMLYEDLNCCTEFKNKALVNFADSPIVGPFMHK